MSDSLSLSKSKDTSSLHPSSLTNRNGAHDVPSRAPRGGASNALPPRHSLTRTRMKKNDNDDDSPFSFIGNVTSALLFNISPGMVARTFLGMTVALYVLNQKHLLPKPLSAVVSKTLFWPTLPITACRRIGTWMTVVDGAVVIGGAPIGFMGLPERLYEEYGVSL